jgi:hypothetical protein
MIFITYEGHPKARNPNGSKKHWGAVSNEAAVERSTAAMLWRKAKAAHLHDIDIRAFHVRIVWTQGTKRAALDFDNAIARCKPLIDGAVDARVIADDRGWCGATYNTAYIKGKPSVTIIIEPVDSTTATAPCKP